MCAEVDVCMLNLTCVGCVYIEVAMCILRLMCVC